MAESQEDRSGAVTEFIQRHRATVMGGAYQGIYNLDPSNAGKVLAESAKRCAGAFLEFAGIGESKDFDAYIEAIKNAGPRERVIERKGNVIFWQFRANGECQCPLVQSGAVELTPTLCMCSTNWVKTLVEKGLGKPVQVELLESVGKGDSDCTFLVHLSPPSYVASGTV